MHIEFSGVGIQKKRTNRKKSFSNLNEQVKVRTMLELTYNAPKIAFASGNIIARLAEPKWAPDRPRDIGPLSVIIREIISNTRCTSLKGAGKGKRGLMRWTEEVAAWGPWHSAWLLCFCCCYGEREGMSGQWRMKCVSQPTYQSLVKAPFNALSLPWGKEWWEKSQEENHIWPRHF